MKRAALLITVVILGLLLVTITAALVIEVVDGQAVLDFIAPTAAQARDQGWTNIVEGL